jgi:hypothetical protein
MKQITPVPLAAAALMLMAPLSAHAALSPYSQNFESVAPAQPPGGGEQHRVERRWLEGFWKRLHDKRLVCWGVWYV